MEVKSRDLQVGDIVYISFKIILFIKEFLIDYLEEHEEVPCDLVVLATSDEFGCCYIQVIYFFIVFNRQ